MIGARVLVVDDEPPIRRAICRILERNGYECEEAGHGGEARGKLAAAAFDAVLCDVNMPGESGLDLVASILQDHPDVATIMVTGVDDPQIAQTALENGAYGYIIKPFETNEILINMMNALRRRALELENRAHRERLEQMVKERTADLWKAVQELEQAQKDIRSSQEETIERLSIAAEYRDDETARHIQRMSRYCELLATRAGEDDERAGLIRVASVMHDVGKIGIPDYILLKPGKLTEEEYEIMKGHSLIGHRILSGSRWELLDLAATIAASHHERWDGTGYPHGIAGAEIPAVGRMAAIADVFDALTTDRVYRKAFSLAEAINIMKEGRGSQFDPDLLDVFLDSLDVVLKIKEEID